MRPQSAPTPDGFGPLFLAGIVAWSVVALLMTGAFHPVAGVFVAGLVALGGTLRRHWEARRHEDARIRAILTTPTEFPAIPLPDYLLSYVADFESADVAAG
jgi:hypothetical protein